MEVQISPVFLKWIPPFTQSFQDIKTEVVLQLGSGLAYAMKQQGSSWWDSAAVCCLGPYHSYHLLLETYPGNYGKKQLRRLFAECEIIEESRL